MPRFDGTGPWGAGPGTGKRMGFCGRGCRPGFWRQPTGKEQLPYLEEEQKSLEEELRALKEEIAALKKA